MDKLRAVLGSARRFAFGRLDLLTDGPLTGNYRAAERLELHGLPKISRADVAHFVLTEIEQRAFVRKVAVLSY